MKESASLQDQLQVTLESNGKRLPLRVMTNGYLKFGCITLLKQNDLNMVGCNVPSNL